MFVSPSPSKQNLLVQRVPWLWPMIYLRKTTRLSLFWIPTSSVYTTHNQQPWLFRLTDFCRIIHSINLHSFIKHMAKKVLSLSPRWKSRQSMASLSWNPRHRKSNASSRNLSSSYQIVSMLEFICSTLTFLNESLYVPHRSKKKYSQRWLRMGNYIHLISRVTGWMLVNLRTSLLALVYISQI